MAKRLPLQVQIVITTGRIYQEACAEFYCALRPFESTASQFTDLGGVRVYFTLCNKRRRLANCKEENRMWNINSNSHLLDGFCYLNVLMEEVAKRDYK